ncbi:WXG100 family type VII secretion target [Streptacidiphilus sp. MAP12-33]|uniref:WXG100 family type VII secretion target n=1 Tax=Streptacidiphilus sp. MAP12-33 TaxID=3156266 RepID=UPI003517CDD9
MDDANNLRKQNQAAQKSAQQSGDAAWKKALAQNAGGQTGTDGFTTDFEQAGGYQGLKDMVQNADPAAMMDVSTHWGKVADALNEAASGLGTHVNNMLDHWTGDSADAFRANATTLQQSLTNGSQYATNTKVAMTQASLALSSAQGDFPHPPSEWDQMTSSIGASDSQFHKDAAQFGIEKALQMDGGDLSAWERVHQQAVVVMERLGRQYNASAAQLQGPGSIETGTTVWPSPPPPAQDNPPVNPYGDNPTGPRHVGDASVQPITGGNGGGHDSFNPGQSGGGGFTPGGGGITGVHGGQGGTTPPGVGGTLDGGLGGPKSGIGAGGGLHGGPGFGGVGGVGTGSGGGRGGFGGGAGVGGFGGLGGGGLGGGGLGGGRLSGAGLGGSGLAEGEGMAAGEGANGMSAAEKAALGAEGEGAGGAGQGEPMGMGGGGGMGSGSQNKKKRKARAGYLVEDEETWNANGASNPGVIDF